MAEPRQLPRQQAPKPSTRQARTHELLRGAEARSVRTRGARIYTGDHPLAVLDGKLLAGEASIEQDFWLLVDFAFEDLTGAYAQPHVAEIEIFGERHTWYPDAQLQRRNRRDLLIEVKPLKVLQPDPEENPEAARLARAKHDAWTVAAAKLGMDFEAWSEVQVRMEPRFHNANVMNRALSCHPTKEQRDSFIEALLYTPARTTIGEFSHILGDLARSATVIACLLDRWGYVRLDRRTFFSPLCEFENFMTRSVAKP